MGLAPSAMIAMHCRCPPTMIAHCCAMMIIAIVDVGPKHPQACTPCIHLFHADASAQRMASVWCKSYRPYPLNMTFTLLIKNTFISKNNTIS
jgi:hypothetical protein